MKSLTTKWRWTCCAVLLTIGIVGVNHTGSWMVDPAQARAAAATPAIPVHSKQVFDCLISSAGIGGIRLGATLAEARRAIPRVAFRRATDGEGVALVGVTLDAYTSVSIWADEDDPGAPIDWSKTIRMIETFSPNCHMANVVRPGMLIVEVEKVFGPVKQIVRSEIESREYISFEQQPSNVIMRLNTTGEFAANSRVTHVFSAGAKLLSIGVSLGTN